MANESSLMIEVSRIAHGKSTISSVRNGLPGAIQINDYAKNKSLDILLLYNSTVRHSASLLLNMMTNGFAQVPCPKLYIAQVPMPQAIYSPGTHAPSYI